MSGRKAATLLAKMSMRTDRLAALPRSGGALDLASGEGRVLANPEGESLDIGLGAGSSLHVMGPDGVAYLQPSNTPISGGSGLFTPIKRLLDYFSNGNMLDLTGESIDAFTLPNGSHRVTSGTLGTFPSTYHKPGILIVTGDETQIFQSLHTHTGRIYQRSARLVSSVMTWGAWARLGGAEVFDFQGFPDDTARTLALGESVTRYGVEIYDNTGKGGLFSLRSAATNLQCNEIASNRTFGKYLTALSGTTGTDGQINIGVQDQTLYVENRTGNSISATIFIKRA